MKELDDDASTEELAKSVSTVAEMVSDDLWEAEGRLQDSRHSEEEIDESLYSIRAFAEDILSSVDKAESELNTAMQAADEVYDSVDEAKSLVDTISRHSGLLVDRVTDGDETTAESEVEIDGTEYRLRLEPLEETDD
jgi:flagellar hook-associated protein FlgK